MTRDPLPSAFLPKSQVAWEVRGSHYYKLYVATPLTFSFIFSPRVSDGCVIFFNLLSKIFLLQSTLACEQGPIRNGTQMLNRFLRGCELTKIYSSKKKRLLHAGEELRLSQMGQWWKVITTFVSGIKTHIKRSLWSRRNHENLKSKINTHLHPNSCKLSIRKRLMCGS